MRHVNNRFLKAAFTIEDLRVRYENGFNATRIDSIPRFVSGNPVLGALLHETRQVRRNGESQCLDGGFACPGNMGRQ